MMCPIIDECKRSVTESHYNFFCSKQFNDCDTYRTKFPEETKTPTQWRQQHDA